MSYKDKITISISKDLLEQIDKKIDKINFKNRSNVIENFVREGLKLKNDIWAVILAHEKMWNTGDYPMWNTPKVLMKIDWKTLIEKHLENLKNANINKAVIVVAHEKEKIINFVNSKIFWMEIEFLEVDEKDLSLKIISQAKNILETNKILVILWDNYFYPLNLTDFIYYHNSNNADLSIIVSILKDWTRYWNIVLKWNDIVKFVEKPQSKEDISFLINTWIYLIDSSKIPDTTKNLKIESNFFPDFIQNAKAKAYFYNWKYFHLQDNETLKLFTK